MSLTKDEWIQKAKALFFDCTFCVDAKSIREEIDEILQEGGGYDYKTESSKTPLRWHGRGQARTIAMNKRAKNCDHLSMTVTEKGDKWCPSCHWTDDDDMETS